MMATRFPPPEVDENRVTMTFFPAMDRFRIVDFLQTLSDGYIDR